MSARTVFPRNQPRITRHLLPTLEAVHVTHRQHKRHRGVKSVANWGGNRIL
jgi:hypothetical protein